MKNGGLLCVNKGVANQCGGGGVWFGGGFNMTVATAWCKLGGIFELGGIFYGGSDG